MLTVVVVPIARGDLAGGVGDEGHRVVVAAVAVVDRAGRGERLARARVLGVEGLGEGRRVAGGQAAGGDRRRGRRGGRAVVALGAGGRGDRDRPRRDLARGVGDEGHRVVVAAVAVVDRAGRRERLARAHVPGVEGLVKAAVSPLTRPALPRDHADLVIACHRPRRRCPRCPPPHRRDHKSCRAAGAIAGTRLPGGASQGGDHARRGDLADLVIVVSAT